MIQNEIKLLDVVALTIDLPTEDLWRGQVGTVVELLSSEYSMAGGVRKSQRKRPARNAIDKSADAAA